MAVPASKPDLLAAIEKTYSALNTDLDKVPLELRDTPFLVGHVKGTMISPAELISYLIGWNEQVLTWHARRASGLPDELPAAGIKWNELGVLAQRYYAEFAELPWLERRARLHAAKGALVSLIEAKTDDELYGAPWYGKWTMGRMISFNTSSPYTNARGRIRAGLKAAAAPASETARSAAASASDHTTSTKAESGAATPQAFIASKTTRSSCPSGVNS